MRHISTFDSQNLVLQSLGWSLLQGQIITRVEHQVPNGRKESFQSITRKNAFFYFGTQKFVTQFWKILRHPFFKVMQLQVVDD
jgi:hypothetical protein